MLGVLSRGEEMRITNLAIETRMSYYGCIRSVSLLEALGWITRSKIKAHVQNENRSDFSHSAISISDSGLEALGRIAPIASQAIKTPRVVPKRLRPSRPLAELDAVRPEVVFNEVPGEKGIPAAQIGPQKRSLRLLLVDDEEDVLFTYESVLKSRGHQVDAFVDSATALSNYAQKGPGSYDVVLLDIRMPKINRVQLFRSIRAIDSEARIVFLTSLDLSPELSSVTEQLGANHLIRKPVTNDEFLKEIETFV